MIYSAASSSLVYGRLRDHLLRADGNEDVAFALWHPSAGSERTTALVTEVIEPQPGDRRVHGNASFMPTYFERAIARAAADGAGLAFLHSHPGGRGWQGLSPDDDAAERTHAGAALGATGRPLVGMTMAGDGHLSARVWERIGPKHYAAQDAETVRVVGDRLDIFFNDRLRRAPIATRTQARSVAAWGSGAQAQLARLRVGVVGLGSVGSIVAEILARTGVGDIRLIDFDSLEDVNLDRTLGSTATDVRLGRSKVELAARGVRRSATAPNIRVEAIDASIVEETGFRAALDCDVLFSCVDRPWPRAALNLIAYGHGVPVVDGGIVVRTRGGKHMLGAEWRAHIASPGRRCLECLGQFDPGLVSAEREGYLDRPSYLEGLPADHPIRRNENVFIFSAATASLEALQMLNMVVAPNGVSNVGPQLYHITSGLIDIGARACEAGCLYPSATIALRGDDVGIVVTGNHVAAEEARQRRRAIEPALRIRRRLVKLLERLTAAIGRG